MQILTRYSFNYCGLEGDKQPHQELLKAPITVPWPTLDADKKIVCQNWYAFTMEYHGAKVHRNYLRVYLKYDEELPLEEHAMETTASYSESDPVERPEQSKISNPDDRDWTWIHLPWNNVSF